MKKRLALILAIALALALFAGCGGGGNNTASPTASASTQPTSGASATVAPTGGTESADPTEDDSPYNFAVGKYTLNERGFPDAPYTYELPLSTTDETFTYWTTVYTPQYLPEDGYGAMDFPEGIKSLTGVNIEYTLVSADVKKEQYSVLLAADDLLDMMTQAISYHPTSVDKALEDGYWVNIYDYKEYCPNLIYQATYDPMDDNIYYAVFYKENIIVNFLAMYTEAFINSNYMARGDWLSDVGLTNDDIVTFDDLHNMLTLFKTNIETCEFPWPIFSSIDSMGTFCAYDTWPYLNTMNLGPAYVVNDQVMFPNMNNNDKEFMTLLSQWFSEGLIDPNWTTYDNNTKFTNLITTNQVGYVFMSPGEINDYETNTTGDDDVSWVPIHKPLKTPGQTIHLGGELMRNIYGGITISATCENIPLAVTWCDWRYSLEGSKYLSWGVPGQLFTEDENGEMMATEFLMTHPAGYSWALTLFALNGLVDGGLQNNDRKYAYEGGARLKSVHTYWADYNYDGAYKWPAGANSVFTQDQRDELAIYKNDVMTYLAENYASFVDQSKPLSEWDDYVSQLRTLGMDKVIGIYQDVYDTFKAGTAA